MSIADNLSRVRADLAAAATAAGRDPESITLVAVSKTWPASDVAEAAAAGQRIFGENKVQELLAKIPESPAGLAWHLIGHLQSNKVRKVLPHCALIHSIDSIELARDVSRIAGELGLTARILLQVNVASDEAKFGFPVGVVMESFAEIRSLPHLEVRGLMTVPPFDEDPGQVRPHFAALRRLRDELEREHGVSLPELSMGMSHDCRIAIEEGATMVRVGSAIFGRRDYGAA
ncbi:MAG: YggS family pyridoxal phosphate-dependent enzyme [Verrucomicrobiales bacterium]|nr:YggS family pyridoxal phosphate-dependent enzyme [Verrucomicrobiales bacterium]